jgi:hypothetical protein
MTGAFGAVVFGAILFEKWQRRIEEERRLAERRDWLHRNLDYARRSQEAMLETLADVAGDAYGVIASVFGTDRVPDDQLRADITRRPGPKKEVGSLRDLYLQLAAFMGEEERLSTTGPLGTAREQVGKLIDGLVAAEFDRLNEIRKPLGLAPVSPSSLPGALRPTPMQVEEMRMPSRLRYWQGSGFSRTASSI